MGNVLHTSCGCVGHYDCLEPHGKEVHNQEVAYCNEKVGHPDQDRYLFFEKGWGEDWFRRNVEFNEEEEDSEYAS